jgi:hypothetical protein
MPEIQSGVTVEERTLLLDVVAQAGAALWNGWVTARFVTIVTTTVNGFGGWVCCSTSMELLSGSAIPLGSCGVCDLIPRCWGVVRRRAGSYGRDGRLAVSCMEQGARTSL